MTACGCHKSALETLIRTLKQKSKEASDDVMPGASTCGYSVATAYDYASDELERILKLPPEWHCQFCDFGEYITDTYHAERRRKIHEQFCDKNPDCAVNSRFDNAQAFYQDLEGM